MTAPRYLNAVLTLIALVLTVIASRMVPPLRAAAVQPVAETQAAQTSADVDVFAIGNEGQVTRLLVWDETTSTLFEYGTNGKVRNKWILKAPGEPLNR